MGGIISSGNIKEIERLKKMGKTIVLVGGCFDILHAAHIEFLQKSKNLGDILVVLLETDKNIGRLKGQGRPINRQGDRAAILSNLSMVDFVISPPALEKHKDYETLVKTLEPDIIALTAGNKVFDWEKEYMERSGGRIVEVMKRKKDYSTSQILKKIIK